MQSNLLYMMNPRKGDSWWPNYASTPVQFNLLFAKSNRGYIITVDLETMHVVQAVPHDMRFDENGDVFDPSTDWRIGPTPLPPGTPYTAGWLREQWFSLGNKYGWTDTTFSLAFLLTDLEHDPNMEYYWQPFDPNNEYWQPFVKALVEIDSQEKYDAFLSTGFPGINEALPGYTPAAELKAKVDAMLESGLGVNLIDYRGYGVSEGPGAFAFRYNTGREDSTSYDVQIRQDAITGLNMYNANEEPRQQAWQGKIPETALQKTAEVAQNFADAYLYGGPDSVLSLRKEAFLPCNAKKPVQYNLLFPKTGNGYVITVDFETLQVVQVVSMEMEVDESGVVVEK